MGQKYPNTSTYCKSHINKFKIICTSGWLFFKKRKSVEFRIFKSQTFKSKQSQASKSTIQKNLGKLASPERRPLKSKLPVISCRLKQVPIQSYFWKWTQLKKFCCSVFKHFLTFFLSRQSVHGWFCKKFFFLRLDMFFCYWKACISKEKNRKIENTLNPNFSITKTIFMISLYIPVGS